ncbi:MAG: hypothetical protein N3D75_03015 [Candidatus Aenigmarchaeota archaeon]|nr:hypothetical protein [Candidatus Aenigmarchaeota archaeon]
MSLEMETVFKYLLYTFVVLVIIGILVVFKDKILRLCLIPPCEKDLCDVKTVAVSEPSFQGTVEKYCDFCYQKANQCKQDVICYIVSYDSPVQSTFYIPSNTGICNYQCNKETSTLYFTYSYLSNMVIVGC